MKVLFIGLGSIGQRHLRNLVTLKKDIEIYAYRNSRSVPLLSKNNEVIKEFKVVAKKIKPSASELQRNKRSRSAIMRVFEKI